MNKVVRCQIVKPVDMEWNLFGDIIHSLQTEVRFIKNKTLSMYNDWVNYAVEQKKVTGEYPKLQDEHGYKTFSGYAYDKLKSNELLSNTSNYTNSIRAILSAYDTKKLDILRGLSAVPNAGKNQPIDLHNNSIKIDYDPTSGDYYATLSLLSNGGKAKYGLKKGQVTVLLKCRDGSTKHILDSCTVGEYKICGSQIIRSKNKLFLNLCYGFEPKSVSLLDDSKIMGVDLGVVVPAYMAFNFDKRERAMISDNRIMNEKHRLDKQLSAAKRNCTYTNNGHGRTNKMRCYERYAHKSKNLSQTINHTWSKHIVEQAIKHGCATIQMEDLSGITNHKDRFLKNWTYYDLQQKIKFKAKSNGIDVVMISPKYTSQRCSECGCICERNHPEQKTFSCVSCGYTTNADFNAARNIAIKGIDKIIASTPITE